MTLYLQKDSSANRVIVQSEQFSQEIELGTSASFDLSLELFASSARTFRLEVANLPEQIDRYFRDPTSGARLSQFRFTESANTRKASLVVSLPDRATEGVPIDQPLDFYVVVAPVEADGGGSFAEFDAQKTWTKEELDSAGVGYARLELLPRGKGKLARARAAALLLDPGQGRRLPECRHRQRGEPAARQRRGSARSAAELVERSRSSDPAVARRG